MILNKQSQAPVLTNVAQTGEFRIRNSAKAFNILSSGLYANKIRAIIRELSCNAVDSHVAAGKPAVAFEVHLPSAMEPWFSVRDYGQGLNHDQVTNIYTIYFESTKTDSNEFIGALGLGSKSPFSYTDNFSITAIKDGVKNIYSAFINDAGVPSVSLMATQNGEFGNSVEVKFSVSDQSDFSRFMQEAREVFKYFKLRPTVIGRSDFTFIDVKFDERDIIPGVHQLEHSSSRYNAKSYAIMGNICYPIDVPNSHTTLGQELASLLECNLVMEFDLGELDFQASREGLSYIPATIDAIKRKLKGVQAALADHLAKKANVIHNAWEKAEYLQEQSHNVLFTVAVMKYMKDAKIPQANLTRSGSYESVFNTLKFTEADLSTRFNISLKRFIVNSRSSNSRTTLVRIDRDYDNVVRGYVETFDFRMDKKHCFITSDCRAGQLRRAREHFGKRYTAENNVIVVLLAPADKARRADYDGFLRECYNPPRVMLASQLDAPVKAAPAGRVGMLEYVKETNYQRRNRGIMFRFGAADSSKLPPVVHYVPLTNKTPTLVESKRDLDWLVVKLHESGIPEFANIRVFGIRKQELKEVEGTKGYVLLEDHIKAVLNKMTDGELDALAMYALNDKRNLAHNYAVAKQLPDTSPFRVFQEKLTASMKMLKKSNKDVNSFNSLAETYRPDATTVKRAEAFEAEYQTVWSRYPMLKLLNTGYFTSESTAVAQYISLIDNSLGANQ